MKSLDTIIEHASEVFTASEAGVLHNATVAIAGGEIVYVGPDSEMAANLISLGWCTSKTTKHIDATGKLVTPGLVDAHTHLIFAGSRAEEFEYRAMNTALRKQGKNGATLNSGPKVMGITSTALATRRARSKDLISLGFERLDRFLSFGVTTLEAKSGYGLDTPGEIRILDAARELESFHPIDIVHTLLAGHAVPKTFEDHRADYVDMICNEMIPEVANQNLAEFCDVFVENIAFTAEEAERILNKGREFGLTPKVHADQLTSCGGAELAAKMLAVSADHLEHISDKGIDALVESGTVAVLLPLAPLFMGSDDRAPARKLLDRGVKVALSTDFNPGTSMSENLPLCATMGVAQLGMTATEAMLAITSHAAMAINRQDSCGSLIAGRNADVAIYNVPSHKEFVYRMGVNVTHCVLKDGEVVWEARR